MDLIDGYAHVTKKLQGEINKENLKILWKYYHWW
jgi:hypothetical protein